MKSPSLSDIRSRITERKEDIIEWTKRFISFPSENRPPSGNERAAQEWLAEECEALRFAIDSFSPEEVFGIKSHPYWLAGRDYSAGRNNLVARWKGRGGRSLLFSGHCDVAPFEPGEWKISEPYVPVVKEGRLYGRGSADMKAGIAAAFWALKILRELSFEPEGDILFESVVDEEFAGGNGTLASRLKGYTADLAVYPEPSMMEICTAGLGAFLGELMLKGSAGMPFTGHEIPNPIFGCGKAIELFKEWQNYWRKENSHALFSVPGKELNVVLWHLDTKSTGELVQMGIPLIAKIAWIVWCYPGMTETVFYTRFREFWEEKFRTCEELRPFAFELRPTYHFIRPWETDSRNRGVKEVLAAYEEATGKSPSLSGAPFSSDMAVYGEPGNMPVVILGPRGDNLHAPDEWVFVDDILTLTEIFACLARSVCGR